MNIAIIVSGVFSFTCIFILSLYSITMVNEKYKDESQIKSMTIKNGLIGIIIAGLVGALGYFALYATSIFILYFGGLAVGLMLLFTGLTLGKNTTFRAKNIFFTILLTFIFSAPIIAIFVLSLIKWFLI